MKHEVPERHFQTDVLIIGGGAAGTMAAFECAAAGVGVIQVTKGKATSGTTTVARGGFAAALGEGDSPESHLKEILEHGGELIDPVLASVWVHDIIDVVTDLREWGAEFVTNDKGLLDLKQFPNHSYPRAVHHYDTTGNALTKTLSRKLRSNDHILRHSMTSIIDLVIHEGEVSGAWGIDYAGNNLVSYAARHVILCSGGGSGLFYVNDNPSQITGDGYVLGYRAGVPVIGLEMIDFQAMCCSPKELFGFAPHPTGFINAGAVFRNQEGEEFLKRYFPKTAEKSTRSEVILAMAKEIHAGRASATGGIFMDATNVPEDVIQEQIPHVFKTCLHRGIDIRSTPLEVAPGSHTWLGGLKIDTDGRTPVPGLWAAGETAGGIHGGNRIGGSALSAALVFGRRAGRSAAAVAKEFPSTNQNIQIAIPSEERDWLRGLLLRDSGLFQADIRKHCHKVAHENLGAIRNADRSNSALSEYKRIAIEDVPHMRIASEAQTSARTRSLEIESALSVRNLALLGTLLATVALYRKESRGAHYRLDFPEVDDETWRVVTRLEKASTGEINFYADPVEATST